MYFFFLFFFLFHIAIQWHDLQTVEVGHYLVEVEVELYCVREFQVCSNWNLEMKTTYPIESNWSASEYLFYCNLNSKMTFILYLNCVNLRILYVYNRWFSMDFSAIVYTWSVIWVHLVGCPRNSSIQKIGRWCKKIFI